MTKFNLLLVSLLCIGLSSCGQTDLGENLVLSRPSQTGDSGDNGDDNGGSPSPAPVTPTTDTPTVLSTTPASPGLSINPTIVGTAEVNAAVEIFSDSSCTTSVGTGTADGTGNFSIAVTTAIDGGDSATYYAQATAVGELVSACSTTSAAFTSTSIRPGLAWLSGTQTTAPVVPTRLNQAVAYPLEWSSSEFDSNYYSHDTATNSEQITVTQAGDYLVGATVPMIFISGTYRPCLRMEIRINGTLYPGAIGQSTYIRNDSGGHTQSSAHVSVLLRGLSANDTIEVYLQESAGENGNEVVNTVGAASLYLEFVGATRTLFTASATDLVSGANINPGTASAFEWTEDRKDTGFTHDDATNPENITLDAGNYLLYVNLPINGSVTRGSPRVLVQLNGTTVAGGQASQGYIRNDSSHNDSSIHWTGLITANANDVLTITAQQEAGGGTINVQAGSGALLTIEKLPADTGVISLRATSLASGTNWNPAAASNMLWQNMVVHDTSVYSHDTATNSHQITVNEAGDYYLVYNDSMTATVQRSNPIIKVQVNGTDVTGAVSSTHYNRNNSGHNESSASLTFLLRNLAAGDIITMTSQQGTESGTVNLIEDTILTIVKK